MFAKHPRFTALAASLCVAASVAPATARATTGLITFNGQLTDSTCEVRGGLTGLPTFIVELPTLSASQLRKNQVAGRTLFRMELANCSAVANGVRVFFENGDQVDRFTGTLATSIPSVHFALFNHDGSPIAIGHETQRTTNTLYQPDEVMHYQVAYRNMGEFDAVAGIVAASVTYSLDYP